jgi:hypothetical protein
VTAAALLTRHAAADDVSTLLNRAVTDGTRLSTVLREPELCIAARSR